MIIIKFQFWQYDIFPFYLMLSSHISFPLICLLLLQIGWKLNIHILNKYMATDKTTFLSIMSQDFWPQNFRVDVCTITQIAANQNTVSSK
jgi:hypothetical protein